MNSLFESKLEKIESHYIIRIPITFSENLPSRGLVMVEGVINGVPFTAPLEPDGLGSHWFEPGEDLLKLTDLHLGDLVSMTMSSINDWEEPHMPNDFMEVIGEAGLINQWLNLTTKAKWDWLRFIRSTKNPDTRQKRIEVACSKLQKGDKRPCCFDRSRCTIPEVSKSGILKDEAL